MHCTKSRTQGRGLGVPVWTGPRTPGQESDGLVLLVPWVQVGRVFLGYPARGIESRIAEKSGMACLRFSTVVRTESGKGEERELIAQLLLESITCAYIEWLDNKLIWLLIITTIRTHY